MRNIFKNRKGQNTVEYLLILAVIVGLALGVGFLIKKYGKDAANSVGGYIQSSVGSLSSDTGQPEDTR